MATSVTSSAGPDPGAMMNFAHRVVGDLAAAIAGPLLYIGDRFGLFRLLADQGPMAVQTLAEKTGLNERYLREWSSAMVAADYLRYDPQQRTLALPAEHAAVLANEDSPLFVGGMSQMLPDHYRLLPQIMHAFQHGGGVPYDQYSSDVFEGTERLFGPGYRNFLARQWLPAMPGVAERLAAGGLAGDVGCGRGRALLALAEAFPAARLVGWDNYAPNIAYANERARQAGCGDRLRFEVLASSDLPQDRQFDLIMTCDCLHDMVSPEACAQSIHGALKEDGVWFCIEPKMADRLEDNISPIGKLFYSVSTLQCMTCSLAHGGSGYGTGMGAANVERVARLAGFSEFRKLPIDHPLNQFFAIHA
ncbi:MAG: class I SAM-dependent methyltransferase [Terriglobales bacterium]